MKSDGRINLPLIVIVGETASGKSSLAMELAGKFNGEIICADSWTVRRGLDIGTAKPTAEDQAKIKHHLLDVVGPEEAFTAAVFKELALKAIKDIEDRGKLPIIAGGTGLYIDSVIFDYGFLPEGDKDLRNELEKMTLAELVNIAEKKGLNTEGIDMRNKRRIIRLIQTNGAKPNKKSLRSNTLVIGLKADREELKEIIIRRVENMITAGLEDEAKSLSRDYGWRAEGLKGIGYKEWREYFEGQQNLDATKQKIIKNTQDLAKRQRTWFRRNSFIQWVNDPSKAVEIATTFLNKKQ